MGKKILRSIIIALLVTAISVILIGCTIALPTFDPSKLNVEYNTTYIYDKNDKQIMQFQAVPGEPAKLNEIPTNLQHALVAVEDSRFYQHSGVDFRGIGRAVFTDLLTGSKAEGGSTLTQQLAKNVYLTQDKTFMRKIKEIYLAAQIERNYSKDDILEMYFNRIYFGDNATGIKAAADTYFAKGNDMKDLTLGECALLAGLPNAPSAYDPWVHPELAVQRRDIVLEAMQKNGYITQDQMKKAEAEQLQTELKRGHNVKGMDVGGKYPYYLDYILQEAEDQLNIPAEQILRGGVKVYTNLDPKVQDALQKEYNDASNFPSNAADGTKVQGASVVVDPKTGGIAGMVGGRDANGQHVFRGFNRASMAQVRPGSSFKPIVDYGPAVDLGLINPSTPLNNKANTTFPGGYAPHNWNGQYSNTVSADYALEESLNVPAASLLYNMGIDKGYQYATQNFGIPLTDQDKNKLGIALGDVQVSPLQMAGAYTAFDNNGVRTVPHAIREIRNSNDDVIASFKTETHQAIKPQTAHVLTKMMEDVVKNGTGKGAQLSDRDVAGKTGSTEMDGTTGDRDIWFAGYTKEYVMVTWMGFDQSDQSHYLHANEGSGFPAVLFSKVMSQALKGTPSSTLQTSDQGPAPANPPQDNNTTTTPDNTGNGVVKDLGASFDGSKVTLNWSPVQVDGVRYFLWRAEKQPDGTAANSAAIADMTSTGYTDTNVQPGKTYMYNVVVWKGNQQLSISNFAEVTIPGQTQAPTPPTQTTPTPPSSDQGQGQGQGQSTGGNQGQSGQGQGQGQNQGSGQGQSQGSGTTGQGQSTGQNNPKPVPNPQPNPGPTQPVTPTSPSSPPSENNSGGNGNNGNTSNSPTPTPGSGQ